MTVDTIMLEIDSARALAVQWAADPNRRQRSFWIGLSIAAAVHALAIIGIGSTTPRSVGTEDGAKNAINVELVDEKSLRDSMSSVTPPPSAPAPQPPAVAEAPPLPPVAAAPPPPAPPTPPEVTPAPPAEPPLPPKQAAATPPVEPIPAEQEAPPPPAEKAKPKAEVPKPAQQKESPPRKKTAELTPPDQLDLSVPTNPGRQSAAPGSSSAVQRPPGITRSGENDEFARNVIRALQKSMPRQEGQFGRVTVRIVLSENGSKADVKLLATGGNADIDFNVMFAARQTAYPFPPKGATVADRTFMVTYIYR